MIASTTFALLIKTISSKWKNTYSIKTMGVVVRLIQMCLSVGFCAQLGATTGTNFYRLDKNIC